MVTHLRKPNVRSRFTLNRPNIILDLIQDGNTNDMFGSWVLDGSGSSVLDFYFLGDSNIWDMNIGALRQ